MLGLDGLLNRFYFTYDSTTRFPANRRQPCFIAKDEVYTRGKWLLVFTYCNEGRSGDFEPCDTTDEPLFRADLSYDGKGCTDGSYCTSFPIDCNRSLLKKGAEKLFDLLMAAHPDGLDTSDPDEVGYVNFDRKVMARWTWTTPNDMAG